MTGDIVIGLGLFVGSLVAIIVLTLWARHLIELIHRKEPTTLRKLQRELKVE